jgi:nitronate monooxygenase
MVTDELRVPIVLAPLAGGPSTPELAAAVAGAGGLGFLAAGYLSAAELEARIARARELSPGPLGVNVFVPGGGPASGPLVAPYVERLRAWAREEGVELGEPRWDDDDYEAKLAVLERVRVPVVSFTFGCPSSEVVARMHASGAEVWVTINAPDEAREAAAAGADAVVAQGAEAGGHRGGLRDLPDAAPLALLPLMQLVRAAVPLPVVASGGLATREAVTAALAAGAVAVQIGTAFMRAREAGTASVHREALGGEGPTVLTRAFTGRLARGIRNRFIEAHEAHAILAYPEVHHVTAPMRRAARERGDAGLINLWAGQAHALAEERPAAEIVRRLSPAGGIA